MSNDGSRSQANRSLIWIVTVLVGIVIVVALAAVVLAFGSSGSSGYGWMMGGGGGWGWMWGVGALMMAIPLILLVVLIFVLLRSANPPTGVMPPSPMTDPVTAARLRYARGELTPEQFRQVLADLQRS